MSSLRNRPSLLGARPVIIVKYYSSFHFYYLFLKLFIYKIRSEWTFKSKHTRKLIHILQATSFPEYQMSSSSNHRSKQQHKQQNQQSSGSGQAGSRKGKAQSVARNQTRRNKQTDRSCDVRSSSSRSGCDNPTWQAQTRRPPAYLNDIAKQIVSPFGALDIVPSPNLAARQVICKRFTRVIDFVPELDHFSAYMSPDLYLPGLVTSNEVVLIPAVLGPLTFSGTGGTYGTDAVQFAGSAKLRGVFASSIEKAAMHVEPITDSAALTYDGFNITTIAGNGSDMGVNVYNKGSQMCRLQLYKRLVGGIWTLVGSLFVPPAGISYAAFTLGASNAIAFRVTSLGEGLIDADFSFASAQATTGGGLGFAPAFEKQIIENSIQSGRVISMSMKITNTSNALSRGGNISIGRVPAVTNAFLAHGDITSSISRLPPNRKYQDLAADGGFAFWMPEEEDEWAFDSLTNKVDTYRNSTFLLAHLEGLVAGSSSFRLSFAWVVEFYSPSQIFTLMETPKWDDNWAEMVRLLVHMDAACCNPASADLVKRLYDNGQQYLQRARAHYNMNKSTYDGLFSILKDLAPALMGA